MSDLDEKRLAKVCPGAAKVYWRTKGEPRTVTLGGYVWIGVNEVRAIGKRLVELADERDSASYLAKAAADRLDHKMVALAERERDAALASAKKAKTECEQLKKEIIYLTRIQCEINAIIFNKENT